MREQAIAEYHEMLAADGSLGTELFARLKANMSAARLLHGERPLGVSLRPHFLTREQYDALAYASEMVAGAFEKVSAAMLSRPDLLGRTGLTEAERRFALIDPGYSYTAVTTRLDAFVKEDEIKFVEYNAENPSSLSDQDGLNQILFEIRALQSLSERYYLRQFTPARTLLNALVETYREWGGRNVPNVAILDWADLPTEQEFILLRNLFVSCGVPTIICSPEELEYTNGKLRRRDFRIDLVYKRVIIHEFLEKYDDRHPLIQAYSRRHVCLVNSFRCKMLHKKAAFELLTDEDNQNWFTPEEREVIRRCVPWTRRVSERKTLYQGKGIDLVDYVRAHRAGFILKPNDDYGGHGISLGNRTGQAEWDEMIELALKNDYVVQEILELRAEEFPVFNEREWGFEPMYVDANPFLFRGHVDGVMVRLSASPVVNVTSGGGETGFFVIEGVVGD